MKKLNCSKQTLSILNISLILVSTLLIFNLFGFDFPSIGFALQDAVDDKDAICFASWQGTHNQINLATCCHEIQKQLSCDQIEANINGFETDVLCKTGESTISYYLTNKAQRYCKAAYN